MTTYNAVFGLTAAVLWAGAIYKLMRLDRGSIGVRASYALVCCLALLASAMTLQLTPINHELDRVVGGHPALLVAEILALGALCAYQVLMVALNDPEPSARRRFRLRLMASSGTIISMSVLYLLSSSPTYPGLLPATQDPFGAAHMALFVAYFTLGAADVARLAFRVSRLGGQRNLIRLALYEIGAGSLLTFSYGITKLIFLALLPFLGTGILRVQQHITDPLIVSASLLTVLGSTLPSWGRWVRADRVAAWFARYMSHLTLYALWQAVVMPDSILRPRSRWADRLLPRDVDFRLTRRVIEIRDGLLVLDPYRSERATTLASTIARAEGHSGTELAAVTEAATIAIALTTRSQDSRARSSAAVPQVDRAGGITPLGHVSLADEVSWLLQVTDAFQHSRAVRIARDRWLEKRRDQPTTWRDARHGGSLSATTTHSNS